ncbi:MAG: alcohol dehydrogenase catalytic domain-containing protein [Myxococcota bacterium]|nr:hypothetical protein [Deltaproteobacteria bacterium]MCP4240053.1 alcohol dehydrogenase catalytic domain-containing protein [bacterium]MDP6076074.1 alcohol dehydrogenase catalytic domain-containing protein [Myxococcota bacterium]MDP7073578.1 alcohol dehydrogenase catalytic domain-containing protein [Myxococcota bacterium]MDP7300734.1 alcohol dehydrogenase catalytic domain-containing protein [Myxococcota bacterium]
MPLPDSMRAAVYREKCRIEVEERPLPVLGAYDALLRVSHCGVCGTDLHLVVEGWGKPGSIGGHEYTGEVAALGERAEAFSLGDRVVGAGAPGCGSCDYCRSHRPGLCARREEFGAEAFQGAFAEYVRVDSRHLLPVPDALSLRDAALTEPLAVALHGVTLSGVRGAQRALVVGAGPIGTLTLAALRARGVEVVVSEPHPLRRKLAESLGASAVLEPDALVPPAMPFDLIDAPFDTVFECSGTPEGFEAGLAQLRRAGTLVIVGTGMRHPRLDPNRVLLNELVITGAYNYDENGFEDAIALLADGALPVDRLVEPVDAALEELEGAMLDLFEGRIGAKVLVAPST